MLPLAGPALLCLALRRLRGSRGRPASARAVPGLLGTRREPANLNGEACASSLRSYTDSKETGGEHQGRLGLWASVSAFFPCPSEWLLDTLIIVGLSSQPRGAPPERRNMQGNDNRVRDLRSPRQSDGRVGAQERRL